MIDGLIKYQAWRTGKIDKSLDEIGLTPAKVTACIDWAIESLCEYKSAHDAEVAKTAYLACLAECEKYFDSYYEGMVTEADAERYAASLNK